MLSASMLRALAPEPMSKRRRRLLAGIRLRRCRRSHAGRLERCFLSQEGPISRCLERVI